MLPDGIYRGWVQHRRYRPKTHHFSYPLAMLLLDLDQLQQCFSQSRWWSLERFNAISFYRRDYLGGNDHSAPTRDLKQAIIDRIFRHCGVAFDGTVKILTHPRYFGVIFNPVSYYFCYDRQGLLQYIVTEINNTPWNERHSYVHIVAGQSESCMEFHFDKQFHVSPFMPMDLDYHWRFRLQRDSVVVQMKLLRDGEIQFDATMKTTAQPLTSKTMTRLPIAYPMQTLLVVVRIYWQALRLWCKRVPFFSHPDKAPRLTEPANGEKK